MRCDSGTMPAFASASRVQSRFKNPPQPAHSEAGEVAPKERGRSGYKARDFGGTQGVSGLAVRKSSLLILVSRAS